MAVNLIKLCVGISSIEELEELQKNRRNNKIARGLEGINVHVTRNTPKRANEIIGKGSLYWVIKRRVVCLLYTSPSPRDGLLSRMPSSA
mgnify:CR=1 FL=1